MLTRLITDPAIALRRATNQVRQQQTLKQHFRRGNATGHPSCRATPVHKHLTRLQSDNLVCWHTTIGAADPQITRGLLRNQAGKEMWIVSYSLSSPCTVSF
jgi:hypothetical protein